MSAVDKSNYISSSLASEAMRNSFEEWLNNGHSKRYSTDAILSCMDSVSAYALEKKICLVSLWDISRADLFKQAYGKIIDNKFFRVSNRSAHKVFATAGQLYLKYLREKPSTIGDLVETTGPDAAVDNQLPDINPKDVVAWLVTQPNANGSFYLESVVRSYMGALRYSPAKLVLSNSHRNVFACHTVGELDALWHTFKSAPNYNEVNQTSGHRRLSAGLAVYRRYLEHLEATNKLEKGRGDIMAQSEDMSARFVQQNVRQAFRSWLIARNSEWSSNTISMHCSDAYYLMNNDRGITLEEALVADDGLQRAYDAIERHFESNPTRANSPSGSARGYLRSLSMLKDFINEEYPEMLSGDFAEVASRQIVPDSLVEILTQRYASGFRFEATALRLLATTAAIEIDEHLQVAMKRMMFHRNDGVYFLLDAVADAVTRAEIVADADSFLQEYGCFEISELYKLYEDTINPKCIASADDFESFYMQIANSNVRCVAAPKIGNRIARYSNGNVWETFNEVSAKIVSTITEEFYGSVNEDDLKQKFSAFSIDLLSKIIKDCAEDKLVRVEINDSICFQTFDALGLPDGFSDLLTETLEQLDDVGLEPSQDTLHTAISLRLGVNFSREFSLPSWEAYRRLVAAFYEAEPRREWKRNVFGEVNE